MKKVFLIILLFFAFMEKSAIAQKKATVMVEVDSIKFQKGKLFIKIFDSNNGFKNDTSYQRYKVTVTKKHESLTFKLPVNQTYAIAMFQDLNANNILDRRGVMDIPDEPIGFSNNKLGKFGPPSFDKIAFTLVGDTTVYIHLISSKKEYFKKAK